MKKRGIAKPWWIIGILILIIAGLVLYILINNQAIKNILTNNQTNNNSNFITNSSSCDISDTSKCNKDCNIDTDCKFVGCFDCANKNIELTNKENTACKPAVAMTCQCENKKCIIKPYKQDVATEYPCIQYVNLSLTTSRGYDNGELISLYLSKPFPPTVKEVLRDISARCNGKKLLSESGKEISLRKNYCSGIPPPKDLTIQEMKNNYENELKNQSYKYIIIVDDEPRLCA